MANTPELLKEERRLKVRELWLKQPSSNRNVSAIAKALGIDWWTVRRDIACMRRQARRTKAHHDLTLQTIEICERYLYEIEQIENEIQECRLIKNYRSIASLRKVKAEIIYNLAETWGIISKIKIEHRGDIVGGDKKQFFQSIDTKGKTVGELINNLNARLSAQFSRES